MPFYDYKCTSCSTKFEIMKGINDPADPKCPGCGSKSRRVFYAPCIGRSAGDILNDVGREQSGACSTCSSGVCSSCSSN